MPAASAILLRLGGAIRARRKALRLSQAEAAWRAGYDHTYWGRVERGEANATLLTLQCVATTLGCTLSELFTDLDSDHA